METNNVSSDGSSSSINNNNNSSANNTVVTGMTSFILPWWQQTVFFLAFIVIFLVASVGNVIVIWIVLAHKRMRTVTNYFLVNLAVADFMISVFNMFLNFTFMMYQDWWFGLFFCKFSWFSAPCSTSVSVLTLMTIAVDRYVAIIYPLRPRMPKLYVIAAICVIWIISIGIAVPMWIFSDTYVHPSDGAVICNITWSKDNDLIYNYLLLVINYLFPLMTLAVTYTRVGLELWCSQTIGEQTSVQHEHVKAKRKVVKMMIIVVVIFAMCWLPQHFYFILSNHDAAIIYGEYTQEIYITIYLIAMSNAMYNPIIYCWMNSRFREGFISVFCWFPCQPCKRVKTRLRFRRTLFPTGQMTMSEKYTERNGSLMQTMTDTVDTDANGRATRIKTRSVPQAQSRARRKEEFM